jgi:hypothetical protein
MYPPRRSADRNREVDEPTLHAYLNRIVDLRFFRQPFRNQSVSLSPFIMAHHHLSAPSKEPECSTCRLQRVFSIFVIEPNNFRPSVLRNMRRQDTCPVCDATIRLAVLAFVLQGSFGEIEDCTVLPRRGLPPSLGSRRYFDLNGASALSGKVLFDNYLWYSQDAITPTTSGLRLSKVNDSRQLRKSSNDSILAALQDCRDIANCQ